MAKAPQDVTDAELAVLQVLWSEGPATIRQLTEAIYPDGGPAYYSTVQKLLERLEGKDCIRRERTESAHVFSAVLGPEEPDRDLAVGKRRVVVGDLAEPGRLRADRLLEQVFGRGVHANLKL